MPQTPLPFDPIEEGKLQWAEAGWADAAPGMGVVGSVTRVQQIFLASLEEALAPFALRFARYEALMLLSFSRAGRVPLGKLSQRLQVHSATVTNVVDRLEAQGLARRRADPDDARRASAVLTPRGRKVALAATEAVRRDVLLPFALPEEQSSQLFALLRRQRIHAGDFVADPPVEATAGGGSAGWAREPLPFDPVVAACDQWERAGWADARQGVAIVGSVFRVDQILMNALERALRPLHLSFARYEVLMMLLFARQQQLPLQELSDRLQVHPASVTNAVQRLQQKGLIRRDANPDDGRSSLAILTAAGYRSVLRATDAVRAEVLSAVGLAPDECEVAFRLLREIRLAAGDFVPRREPRPLRPPLRGEPPAFHPPPPGRAEPEDHDRAAS